MPAFKDTNGREWLVKIDAPLVKAVRAALGGFDLLGDEAFSKLAADDVLLVDTLWVLCRGQANGLTDVEFGQALGGQAIEEAGDALTQARRDFFRPRKRSLLRSLEDEQAAILSDGMALAQQKVANPELRKNLLQKVEAEMDKALSAILTGPTSASSSPASAESGPTD